MVRATLSYSLSGYKCCHFLKFVVLLCEGSLLKPFFVVLDESVIEKLLTPLPFFVLLGVSLLLDQ